MRKEVKLSKFQKEFIKRSDEDLLILATGISAGKSKVAGLWCVLETLNNSCRIIAAAQTYRALTEVLFREITNWLNYFEVEYKYSKVDKKFELFNGSTIFGATAEDPAGILGFTDISAAIIDEAAYCPEELYHFIGDRMRGLGIKPKYRLISSPSNKAAAKWFTMLCAQNPNQVIHATALDNPFTSPEFKESLKKRYGEGSPLYRQQVLGEFIESDSSDLLVNISDFSIEPKLASENEYFMGVDISRFGVDRTCIVLRDNREILDFDVLHQADSHRIISSIQRMAQNRNVKSINLDGTGGFSAGVYDIMKLSYDNVFEINFGAKSPDSICANNRSYMYMKLRDAIKDGFYIKDKDFINEICAQKVQLNNRGLFQLVPKEVIKEEIGKSPDLADALALSFYSETESMYINITPEKQKLYMNSLFR